MRACLCSNATCEKKQSNTVPRQSAQQRPLLHTHIHVFAAHVHIHTYVHGCAQGVWEKTAQPCLSNKVGGNQNKHSQCVAAMTPASPANHSFTKHSRKTESAACFNSSGRSYAACDTGASHLYMAHRAAHPIIVPRPATSPPTTPQSRRGRGIELRQL
jgi:hypothetical protein